MPHRGQRRHNPTQVTPHSIVDFVTRRIRAPEPFGKNREQESGAESGAGGGAARGRQAGPEEARTRLPTHTAALRPSGPPPGASAPAPRLLLFRTPPRAGPGACACRRAVPPRVPPRAPPRVLAARACGAGTQRCARCAAALRGGTGAAPRRLAWAARDTVPASRTSLCSTLVRCAPTPTGVADCHEYSAWSDALLGN